MKQKKEGANGFYAFRIKPSAKAELEELGIKPAAALRQLIDDMLAEARKLKSGTQQELSLEVE